MPFIPAIDCVLAKMVFDFGGKEAINTFWFYKAGGISETERGNLATALHTFWTSHLKDQIANNVGLVRVEVSDQSSQFGPTTVLTLTSPEYGTGSSAALPSNVSAVVTARTNQRGRNYRGRVYVPGIQPGVVTGVDGIGTGWIANILTAFSWLLTPANVAGLAWAVVSHFFNKAPRGSAALAPITGVTMDAVTDSMRRRLKGRGA